MNSIFYDAAVTDEIHRENLFHGQLYVYSPRPSSIELCRLAGDMAKEAFTSYEPPEAQHYLLVERFAEILLISNRDSPSGL